MKRSPFALAALACLASAPAVASIITLAPVDGNLYQQTVQSPCVFSNPSCQQGSFPATPVPNGGNVSSWDLLSPNYSGATLLSLIGAGNSLLLGLDINQASGQPSQTLTAFNMLINGAIVDTYTGPMNVPAGNNGNGYADYLLGNFSSFLATDTIQFRFAFDNATSGAENVFLVRGGGPGDTSEVPEPGTLAILGLGLTGLAFARRRRG